jgi:peptidoglycan/LPS O-acetylase OafA/YrhL
MFAPFGWVGVQVFFVISGVVIANSAANATPSSFVWGRFLRLYPAAWIAAIVNLGFLFVAPFDVYHSLGISVSRSFESAFYSVTLAGGSFLASAYWTLPVELAFYGLIFVCLINGGAERFRLIARTLIILSAAYLSLLCLAYTVQPSLIWVDLGYGRKNMVLLRHGVFFAIGMYFWLINSRHQLDRIDYGLLIVGLAAAGLEIYSRAAQVLNLYAVSKGAINVLAVAASAFAVFAMFTYFIFLSLRNAATWIPSPQLGVLLRTLGLVTYPYYLTHEAIGGFALTQFLAKGLGRSTSLCLSLATVGAVAYVIACHAEPFLRSLIISAVRQTPKLAETGDSEIEKRLR